MYKKDEVICIKMRSQHRNAVVCFYLVHFRSTVKAKVKFRSKASYGVFIAFHGTHALFTSVPYLIVTICRGGTVE